jgi:multiple sugar transport system substrate-binding protein
MASDSISRRDFLRLSGLVTAGAVLAGCAPKVATPAATQVPGVEVKPTEVPTAVPTAVPTGKVVVAHRADEFGQDIVDAFQAANPGITIEAVSDDPQKVFAMLAAGTPPDMLRAEAPYVPQFLARHILRDLTGYFGASAVLHEADLAPVNNYYRAKSPLEVGSGPIYGMAKDWSPDFTVWINDDLVQKAGQPAVAEDKPLTWQEVFDLAKATAQFEGERIVIWGYGYGKEWTDRIIMNALAEKGESLYKDSYSAIDWSDDAKSLAKYFFDMAVGRLTSSGSNPSPNGWDCGDFLAGTLTLMQYGYWASPMMLDPANASAGKCRMLPAPTWSGVHRNPSLAATGDVLLAQGNNPDAAWKVFEYFLGGDPSVARAKSGWGVPSLLSQMSLMPSETDAQKQVQRVLAGEMAVSQDVLQFNPFLGPTSFSTVWTTYFDQAVAGTLTFDDMLTKVETEVNGQISEGIDRIG